MGCAQTRDQKEQHQIEKLENNLRFTNLTVSEIKQAFFDVCGSNHISKVRFEAILDDINLKYSTEQRDILNKFLSAFIIFQEEDIDHYDLTQLLIALFVLSKSSQNEKAVSLFNLFDDCGENKLDRVQLETALYRIIDTIFLYSENLLDNDEGIILIHEQIVSCKVKSLDIPISNINDFMPKILEIFFKAREVVREEDFQNTIHEASKAKEMIDFTNPTDIRNTFMEYVNYPKLTQIELQQKYEIRMSLRKQSIFKERKHNRMPTFNPTQCLNQV